MNQALQNLEEEAIYIIREVLGQSKNPCLLFSGGKDSIVLVHLALKASAPAKLPFPLVHIDTGHNFEETLAYRDALVAKIGAQLVVGSVQEDIDNGHVLEEVGPLASRNALQTTTLLRTIEAHGWDACLGGARRDEEKARAKERIFSVRDVFGGWNEKNQRPELFNLLNGRIHHGEHLRVFPISNWTELDVWNYIKAQNIELPSLYFAHKRSVFERKGVLMPTTSLIKRLPHEVPQEHWVRFRTVGDMSCTAAVASMAQDIDTVIQEISGATISERGARIDDQRSEGAMEERKKAGYF